MSFFKKLFGSKHKPDSSQSRETKSTPTTAEEVPWMTEVRLNNLAFCNREGFVPSRSLPTNFDAEIRLPIEIAKRLHALKALILWILIPEEQAPSSNIHSFVELNGLREYMTLDELNTLQLSRDDQQARDAMGWKFENVWPLAWYFGYEEIDIKGEMMSGDEMLKILQHYSCSLNGSVEQWIQTQETISEDELLETHDLFYCLHNAVRSAQLGGNTVPAGFNPVLNGGVIHERRHSLTWMISKNVRRKTRILVRKKGLPLSR